MMSTTVQQPATTPIPGQLSEPEFEEFIVPHLSMPKRGPKCKLGDHRVFHLIFWVLYTGMPWKCLPGPKDPPGKPAMHYTTVDTVLAQWADDGARWQAFLARVRPLADQTHLDRSVLQGDGTNTGAPKGGDGLGYSGYTHQKGEKVIARPDNHGYVLAPVPVAPVNATAMVLLPQALKALKPVAQEGRGDLTGADVNLDGGVASRHQRKLIFKAGMIPNIKETPRHRQTTKRGRKRFFNEAIQALRMHVERTCAWEDKFKRLLLHFERMQQRHYGRKLMAYTLINLREFCGV